MITTLEQAQRIQKRRYEQGKRGTAKAVRRYCLRVHPNSYRHVIDAMPRRMLKPDGNQ